MKSKRKFIDIVATVAPTLATALGGPLAGVATRAIADQLLGKPDASPDEIEAAIAGATGADLVRLKEIEAKFAAEMKEAGVELERVAAMDRDSARARQVQMRDWTPTLLGLTIIVGFFGVLAWIFHSGLPERGGEVLLIMVGALGTMTTQVNNYFFGSTKKSGEKTEIIASLKGGRT
ncbi:hypothetical protein QO034_06465 [Sedimentitalea sp. JM2-8]|uniref:Holin of 3TMs, for gene-transfer release n=1 Tax=Sedimentitalea xiamensis TaxID=3050037 RepID=A0ABT7FCA5_9RHOB|nr:hypothetical protein [Sedimentitalea xiamensis]MDK3072747.1 hypothetical protein [Sedimentitalea xiamensis]